MNNPFEALAGLRDKLPEGQQNECGTESPASGKPVKKTATLFYESKGRGGKEATIIEVGGSPEESEMKELASELKRRLATGGSVRGNEILLQGDRRAQLRDILARIGFKVKG